MIPHQIEKFYDQLKDSKNRQLAPLNFYYILHLSRRKGGLIVKGLAQQADVDFEELMALERDTQYKLKLESVVKLAKYFGVDENELIKTARLDKPAVKCPDQVASTDELGDLALMVVIAFEKFRAMQAQMTCMRCKL